MKVKMTVYGGEKHPVTFTNVKKIERNVVFTLIFQKNTKIKDAMSYSNSNIKHMIVTNEK